MTQAYLITVVILLAAWGMRATATLRQRRFAVIYPSGKKVRAPQGLSVLDVSRLNKIPHASVCGGRGRCSTCRVRVVSGLETLPEPSSIEAKVLGRLGYPERVRLACQLYPRSDLSIVPIVAPPTALRDALGAVDPSQGVEREIAVLFADIRDFTRLAEGKLPYDVVYLLNQYSRQMGEQIEAAGGHLDKFIGDGVMALFGINDAPETAARSALTAAQGMGTSLEELNESLASDLNEPLRIGIGLHMGSSIVGEIGYGRARQLTAIGDAVNVASRLEGLTKERRVQLVVSEQLITRAGIDAPDLPREDVAIRGRTSKLAVRLVERAADLHSSSGPEPPAA
ncbi:MAG: adenylate/guanylate cyclase domain-containing protein [Geminicoccaceae bacterium]